MLKDYINIYFRYARKALSLGPKKTIYLVARRLKARLHDHTYRFAASKKLLNHGWADIQKNHNILYSFDQFKKHITEKQYTAFQSYSRLQQYDEAVLKKEAEAYVNQCFDLLGSEQQCFASIAWHDDFRLAKQRADTDFYYNAGQYYKDIVITAGSTERLEKDIKIPWELSRFQHLFTIGFAYHHYNDPKYAEAFVSQVSDWIEKNPILLGPNWVCPMDVGIRALNWIWAFYFFRNAETITEDFWKLFACSLYDHVWYLERNWEIYDTRTSNHYLSDLIGYYYLCLFFIDLPGFAVKADWCHAELLKEFDKQIFDEGTSYEGSTAYHRLVTEIFYHFFIMSSEFGHIVTTSFIEKLQRMFTFLDLCTLPNSGELIQIGDNDSGKILNGLSDPIITKMYINNDDAMAHYPKFGISFIKTDNLHVSLRYHSYQSYQPSGHFHNDVGSITLSHNGIPILIDPGSYVYTPSQYWRNYFRSVKQHNSFGIVDAEPVLLDDQLFKLSLPDAVSHTKVEKTETSCILQMQHDLYGKNKRTHRTVKLDLKSNELIIADSWQCNEHDFMPTEWNYIFHPNIKLEKRNSEWLICNNNVIISILCSPLLFNLRQSWFSPSYGIKIPCLKLNGQANIEKGQIIQTRFLF